MRIQAIQTNYYQNNRLQTLSPKHHKNTNTPSFKGGGGAFYGFGLGLIGGLLTICTAGAALPALVGAAGVVGTGCGGAYLGDKIEDKLNGSDKKDD